MPGFPKLSLVEGAFEELALELATYLDNAKGDDGTTVADITPSLADPEKPESTTDKDAVLKKLVTASSMLNGAPERELQAAYNLLIHLVTHAEDQDPYLNRICQYLAQPLTSSPSNGGGIALGILSTLFNQVQPDDETRFHVLLAIISVIKNTGNFDTLAPQLKNVDSWVEEWELEPAEARTLYLAISDAATTAKETEDAYHYLLKALNTIQTDAATSEARELSIRALKFALQKEKHFDFQDLTALDSVQALRKSDETLFELLELFSTENFDDLQDFKEGNGSFLQEQNLDEDILDKKMRLLTFASLAAAAHQTRTLPYAQIAKALQIPSSEVEMWVIDSIRSGLVEGKLSQQKQEFLIHRSTYRVFGDSQWREVASRLDVWRNSLQNVLAVIRQQKEDFVKEKEQELQNTNSSGERRGYRPSHRERNERREPQAVEVE
ncbi:putative proteasome component (PCI) domain, eIF3 subunit M helix domain-containing protein [Septoria linicola]|nr:putative proteasome component (PCI) domain, eIF3 subunit M helix domain-containing protein [Septoria linicola]